MSVESSLPGVVSSRTALAESQGALERARIGTFARQTPLNAAVTLVVSALLALILWPAVPDKLMVIAWICVHQAVGWYSVWRYLAVARRRRARSLMSVGQPRDYRASRRRALWSGVAAGTAWGSSALFLPVLPPVQQMAVIIVIAAMAGGASTTLSAMPGAATAYVLCAILPAAAYFALQAQLEYAGLAVLAIVMSLAMVVASRIVYGMVQSELRSREKSLTLLEQLRAAQHAWLQISRTTEAFALFDARGRLQHWNDNLLVYLSLPEDAMLANMTQSELIALSSPALQPTDHDARLLQLANRPDETLVSGLANGRWLRTIARRTEDGSVVVVHVDITDLKRAEASLREREEELLHAQKLEAIGKLAGGVAHDFNNILTVIIGYAQLLGDAATSADEIREAALQIDRAAERAAALTRQLLAFSRKQQLQPQVWQLNAIVRDLQPMLVRLLPASIDLDLHLHARSSFVRVDRQQMEQVLLNLAVNARDAMSSGGHLRLRTADAADDCVRLQVIDDGAGMDALTRERAFEPFYTTKPAGQGTGLGLASVYGFVTQSGGNITLTSAPGAGCRFDIVLPRAAA